MTTSGLKPIEAYDDWRETVFYGMPEGLNWVGYDHEAATMHVSTGEYGRKEITFLLDLAGGFAFPPVRVVHPPQLVLRDSVRGM